MRRVIFFLIISLCSLTGLQAQDESREYRTLFGNHDGKIEHGGYGAFGVGYTTIDDRGALLMSFRGAWIINHRFAMGLAGHAFFNNMHKVDNTAEESLGGGYGGFYFEPILFPEAPVHLAFPVLIGGGGVSTISHNYWDNQPFPPAPESYDMFFVVEPGIEAELNMVRFFRLAAGVSYRFTNGILLYYSPNRPVPEKALNSFSFYLKFKFGKF